MYIGIKIYSFQLLKKFNDLFNFIIIWSKPERKMNAVETRSFRSVCEYGVSLTDRIRNEEIQRMAGTGKDITMRMK